MKPLHPVIYKENKFEYHTVHSNNLFIHKGLFNDYKNVNMRKHTMANPSVLD